MIKRLLIALIVLTLSAQASLVLCASEAASNPETEGDSGQVTEKASGAELIAFGEKLRAAIITQDVEALMAFMEHGVATPNDPYTREEVRKKLEDKTSWLYQRLFVDYWSAKGFFERNPGNAVDLLGACDAYVISYVSADGKTEYPCNFVLFKYKGKLQIWQFPACPSF
ncbi:MAG: hypothetical protein ACLGSA_04030 [Acidobacteriota bacterium]